MKRLVALVATVAMSATVLVGCKSDNAASDSAATGVLSVGLVTDEGGINDKSFNQTANLGVEKAVSDLGVSYKYVESAKKEDYEPNIQSLIDNGAQLTYAVGYQLADAVKVAAQNNPDSKFCLIDSVVEADNVQSVTFKEEEGSFLMGVIAGLTTKTNKVGFIGGKDQDTIVRFEAGFAAGVKAVNPEAAVGLISADGTSAGSTVKYADSFSDTNKGYELATSLYEAGCDVLYHAAGGVGIGMFQAAKAFNEKGQQVWAIGVDMDQAYSLPEFESVILSSMMKRVDLATFDAAKAMIDGNFEVGTKALGIAEGAIGMADSTSKNTAPEVIEKASEFEEKVKNGDLAIPATRSGVINFQIQ